MCSVENLFCRKMKKDQTDHQKIFVVVIKNHNDV